MLNEKAYILLQNDILKTGCRIKIKSIKGFEDFIEIDDAFVKEARAGEMEENHVVVVINGTMYDSSWIDEVETKGVKSNEVQTMPVPDD